MAEDENDAPCPGSFKESIRPAKKIWICLTVFLATNILCLVLLKLFSVALPIAQIAIGAVYLKECPQQHFIPVYVLVCGVFGVSLSLLACLPCSRKPKDGGNSKLNRVCCDWNSLVSIFLFCWFICGNVWIYSIYPPNYNQTVSGVPYCNKTLYMFAFWTTTLGHILFGAVLLIFCCACVCCLCGCLACLGKSEQNDEVSVPMKSKSEVKKLNEISDENP
ncbi:transmembrane protein 272-like [Xyrauchen texanus]|uniref:transmembrane protein 272-like n=1 Tax=Xyrauchen texanus TaxID=154827 RepID=UPI00224279D3|nr:transmembrane protein 272-like [Xyrauchen texanus]